MNGQNVNDNIIMNVKKPPFDNLKVRLAVSHAIDRRGLCRRCTRAAPWSAPSMRPSRGASGVCSSKDLVALPGYGKPADEKAKARKLLAEAGFTARQARCRSRS